MTADDSYRERAVAAIELLEELRDDPAAAAVLEEGLRNRLRKAAGQVARPGPDDKRALARASRKRKRIARRKADERVLATTGIRVERQRPVFATPLQAPALPPLELQPAQVERPRSCYVCKREFTALHFFYDQMCAPCAELNWAKRNQTADLSGRVALITGARVKIGYQAGIKLLRAGARVVVTTRFPRDAAARYAREPDFAEWGDRLQIYGLDLRHTPSVDAFARHMVDTLSRLDFILNNACQTVRRPAGFYAHLMAAERAALPDLPRAALALVNGVPDSAELSQVALLDEDRGRDLRLFPAGQLDADLQQVDLRSHNSWRMPLAEVSAVELLEVQLVNAVAPFILNARLKALMLRHPSRDKHIVNVSAMEGQFYRRHKTDKHPHTNMAKAALNMMTRTSAVDYVQDGIHMNSVDTGWVTDEDPAEIAARKVEEHGFHPPLDIVDGAARIVDPIFTGLSTGRHVWGQFLKDYAPTDW